MKKVELITLAIFLGKILAKKMAQVINSTMAKLLTLLFWPKKLKINISKILKKPYFYSVFWAASKKKTKKSQKKKAITLAHVLKTCVFKITRKYFQKQQQQEQKQKQWQQQ